MSSPLKDNIIQNLQNSYNQLFGKTASKPILIFVPFCISPLGVHIDHQGGRVTGFPIDKGIYLMVGASNKNFKIQSLDNNEVLDLDINEKIENIKKENNWQKFPKLVYEKLKKKYKIKNSINAVTASTWEKGGLGNTTAEIIAYISALAYYNNIELSKEDYKCFIKNIENESNDDDSEILNQTMILDGKKDHITLYDTYENNIFQILETKTYNKPLFVLIFSGLKKALMKSDYKKRIEECNIAARFLYKTLYLREPEKRITFREIINEYHPEILNEIPDPYKKRALHYLEENIRVVDGIEAYKNGEWDKFGYLINRSCNSSINNYQSGNAEIISLWTIVKNAPGCYGSRFCGRGYRGSLFAICNPEKFDDFKKYILMQYNTLYPQLSERLKIENINSCDGYNGPM